MEILVAIVIIVLIAAVAFAVMRRRPDGAGNLGRRRTSPVKIRTSQIPPDDPMAWAVVEHAEATGPREIVVAEQRLQAQARQKAAGLQADALRNENQRASDQIAGGSYAADLRLDDDADPRYDDRSR